MTICLRPLFYAAMLFALNASAVASAAPPNILVVTVDDMSCDSLGVFGCKLNDTSPNIDAFAREAMRFNYAHVQVGNCMPGRNLMWSGMFSHANGVEGFVQNKQAKYAVLCDLAKAAGYFTGIRGKTPHSTPYTPYAWDAVLDTAPSGKKYALKNPKGYGDATRQGIRLAKEAKKPFCLMVNISDPHKPFYSEVKGNNQKGAKRKDPHVPTRVFTADEVPVPGFLPSDEKIKAELALYYSSVRRADDCFGEVMAALEESGEADSTFIFFLSDHGMPLPFAKTQLYHHSTWTPLIVKWPGVTKQGTVDDTHMVSAIDFLPTLLEVMEHEHPNPDSLHGRSFASILRGEKQTGRDHVVLQYNENAGRNRHPMRGIQTRDHLYLYNPWSDGKRKFATATTGTVTYRQMVKRAPSEPAVARRLELFDHRVLEELYNVAEDPDCLKNLVANADTSSLKTELRQTLLKELQRIEDPVAFLLADVDNAAIRDAYMAKEDERTQAARRQRQAKRKKGAAKGKSKTNSN